MSNLYDMSKLRINDLDRSVVLDRTLWRKLIFVSNWRLSFCLNWWKSCWFPFVVIKKMFTRCWTLTLWKKTKWRGELFVSNYFLYVNNTLSWTLNRRNEYCIYYSKYKYYWIFYNSLVISLSSGGDEMYCYVLEGVS